MVWASFAASAKSMRDCYSRQIRNQNRLGVHRGTCNRGCGLPLLPDIFIQNQKSGPSRPVMNGISYLYYDAVNQKSSLFRPVVRYLCNAFPCVNLVSCYPVSVFSSCHIVKLGIKSHGCLSTMGIRFVLSFSLRSVAKLSIKSHRRVSIVGICLANVIRLLFSESRSSSWSVFISSLVLSLVLCVPRSLIPAFLSRSYPSSESVYRLPGMYVISSCQFEFVVKSVSQCRLVVVLVFKSRCLVSFLGTVVCSVEFCIVLDLIGFRVLTFNRKGRSVLKKGRDGRNSCTSCHSVTENCYPVLGSLNPPSKTPTKKNNLFGSVSVRPVSHTVICLLSCPGLGIVRVSPTSRPESDRDFSDPVVFGHRKLF